MRQRNISGQVGIGLFPAQFVGKMGEVGAGGFEMVNGNEGFADGHVGGMPVMTESIDNEDVEIVEKLERRLREGFDVGNVGNGAGFVVIKTESMSADAAMLHFDGGDGQSLKLKNRFEGAGLGSDVSALGGFSDKGPGIHSLQSGEGFLGAVEWEGILTMPAKGAEFIEARDVVDVFVSVEDGIDFGESFTESLLAEVGSAVDEEGSPRAFEEGGAAGAVVPWVIGGAGGALAADDRDAHRGGCSQKKEAALW